MKWIQYTIVSGVQEIDKFQFGEVINMLMQKATPEMVERWKEVWQRSCGIFKK